MLTDDGRILIVAEAGVNHNGSLDMALELVDAAAAAGADAVKFQTFAAEKEICRFAPKAEYQTRTSAPEETQLAMVKMLELSRDDHFTIARRCRERNVVFLSTPFEMDSLRFLIDDMRLPIIKFSSGDLTCGPLLLAAAESGVKVILSTGMATLEEIEDALSVLAAGYVDPGAAPSWERFRAAHRSDCGQAALRDKVTLLHCVTEYPAPVEDANLRAMRTMAEAFGLRVGYSDHSAGPTVPLAAAALGAVIIEKHLTLDNALPGPDHLASMEPAAFAALTTAVRQVEAAMGDGVKAPAESELKNVGIARKSLVAGEPIGMGAIFTPQNLTYKRPGTGLSPMRYWDMLGKTAIRAYYEDEIIDVGD